MTTRILDAVRQAFWQCTVDWDQASDVFTIVWDGWDKVEYNKRLEEVQAILAKIGESARFKHIFTLTPAELAIFNSL